MSTWERWLLPIILATVGLPFLLAGGLIRAFLPQSIANQAQEVARLPVATADTLNERGAPVLLEGQVSDRNSFSDRPPLVAYNEYHRVRRDDEWKWEYERSYNPTLWVQIPGKEVEIEAGYSLQSTSSQVQEGSNRSYEGFEVNDPVLVLGTLSVAGERPVVAEAKIGAETKETYLVSLEQNQATARWLGLLFLVLGSLLILGAGLAVYLIWRGMSRDR